MLRSTLSSLRDWREYLTPAYHVSSFKETGQITPEEFVKAGDYLVYKFPTWSWAGAPASKRRDFLPDDKQVLVTKHVPSHLRAGAFIGSEEDEEDVVEDEEGWVSTAAKKGRDEARHKQVDGQSEESSSLQPDSVEEIVDIDDFNANDEAADLEDDEQIYQPSKSTTTNKTSTTSPDRTYNLFITYSTSYRVPKFYLSGFNADGNPLSPNEMFEDIVSDYRDKTVTIEKAPFEEDLTLISVHPCRHANVMKILLDRAENRLRQKQVLEHDELVKGISKVGLADSNDNDWEEIAHNEPPSTSELQQSAIRVDQYLIIFLKFIASVTPGIEHDNTMVM